MEAPGFNPDAAIEELGYMLTPVRMLFFYFVSFTPDMSPKNIEAIIRTAASKGETRVRQFKMTLTNGIAFLPKFPSWPDDAQLHQCTGKLDLIRRVLAQGWAGLLLAPFKCWHVSSIWHLAREAQIKDTFGYDLAKYATALFFEAKWPRASIVSIAEFIEGPVADESMRLFGSLYPEFLIHNSPMPSPPTA